jgi:hypothetical protein
LRFIQEHVALERVAYKVNTVLGLAQAIEQGLDLGHLPCFIGDARSGLVRLKIVRLFGSFRVGEMGWEVIKRHGQPPCPLTCAACLIASRIRT